MITVTHWNHSSTDTALILSGTPDQTINQAAEYFGNDTYAMHGVEGKMTQEEFDKLPEFES